MLKISQCDLTELELDAVRRVMFDNGYLGMSSETKAFEEELKAFLGGEMEVVCVNTGTSALHLACQAIGLEPGDEVLVPTTTFVASFQAISAAGAVPVACDIVSSTMQMDLLDAKSRITPRTKAIMPVHFAGGAGDLDALHQLAREYKLRVIEDAAHSFGGTHNHKKIGTTGDIVCFSFDGIKNLTCGEGGAIVTRDKHVADYCRDGRLLGVHKDTEKRYTKQRSWEFDVHHQGWRYHMSDINASIGRAQLSRFPVMCHNRQHVISTYVNKLKNHEHIKILDLDYDKIVSHIFCLNVNKDHR
jgi:dTDP-4-amino-4,6-dideoxygalactose transaminase